jgi:hypothetical protein
MSLSFIPSMISAEAVFLRVPGLEEDELRPGELSMNAITEGVGGLLNTGAVTMLLLPLLALMLYFSGYRVAGPMVALFAVGLFAAKMFGTPA